MYMVVDFGDEGRLVACNFVVKMTGKLMMQMVQDHDHFW